MFNNGRKVVHRSKIGARGRRRLKMKGRFHGKPDSHRKLREESASLRKSFGFAAVRRGY